MKKWSLLVVISLACAGCQHTSTNRSMDNSHLNSTPLAKALVDKPQTTITQLFGQPNSRSTLLPELEQWRYKRVHDQHEISCEVIITFRNKIVEATVVKIARPHLTGYLVSPCDFFESKVKRDFYGFNAYSWLSG